MYRRYLKVQPTEVEDFIKFLKKAGRVEEAAKFLAQVLSCGRARARACLSSRERLCSSVRVAANQSASARELCCC